MRFTIFDHKMLLYGQRYEFTAIDLPRGTDLSVERNEACDWCADNLGGFSKDELTARWWPTPRRIWIRDEPDAFLFKMRWC